MLRGNTRRKTNNIQSGIESQSCVWRDTHDPVRVALSLVWPSMGVAVHGNSIHRRKVGFGGRRCMSVVVGSRRPQVGLSRCGYLMVQCSAHVSGGLGWNPGPFLLERMQN